MKKIYFFSLIKIVFLSACFAQTRDSVTDTEKILILTVDSTTAKECTPVLFSELLANPKKYDLKCIELRGYFVSEYENIALYLSEEDIENHNFQSAIWVDFDKNHPLSSSDSLTKLFNSKDIKVKGIYDIGRRGHLGSYQGSLKNVYYIEK